MAVKGAALFFFAVVAVSFAAAAGSKVDEVASEESVKTNESDYKYGKCYIQYKICCYKTYYCDDYYNSYRKHPKYCKKLVCTDYMYKYFDKYYDMPQEYKDGYEKL